MQLLSSDFDETYKIKHKDPNTTRSLLEVNNKAIEQFRKDGNIFLLNTGRVFDSINKKAKEDNVLYDYLACCDGSLLLDKDGKTLFSVNLDMHLLNEFTYLKRKFPSIIIEPLMYEGCLLRFKIKEPLFDINLYQELERLASELKLSFLCMSFDDACMYFLDEKGIDKGTSVHMISDIEEISREDIYTVGDDLNDLPMILRYNGYVMSNGRIATIDNVKGIVTSVDSLIKRIGKR